MPEVAGGMATAEREDRIWNLEIKGNATFSNSVIDRITASEEPTFWEKISFWSRGGDEVNENEIKRDVIRIQRFYQRRGFIHVKVSYRLLPGKKEWKKKLVFTIDENQPIVIQNLEYRFKATKQYQEEIEESAIFKRAREKHVFQPGNRYAIVKEPDVIGGFNDALENLGFAYTSINVGAQVDSTRNTADVTIEIEPGVRTYIEDVNVQGVQTVSEDYVVREGGINTGEQYKKEKLQEAQREIFNHHLFRFATISIPQQEQDSSLTLDITVREHELRSVQALVGFGSEEFARFQLGWTHRNAFYKGHRFTATGRVSFIEQSANLGYLFPYTFNTNSSVVISPFFQRIEEKSFELIHGGITNSLIYRPREDLTGTVSYQFSRNLELSQQLDVTLPDTTFEYNLSSLQLSGYYSPGYSRAGEGWVIQPFAELSGFFGGATFSFQKLSLDIRRFTRLTPTTMLATRVQAGGLFSAGQDSLPNNIRFFLGGTSSVRGWFRQELGPKQARVDSIAGTDSTAFVRYVPIGGRAMFGFNIEVRQELNSFIKGMGIAVFLDGGQVWQSTTNLGARPLQFGLGGGLRYNSPIGPIRIDVGYKLNPTDKDLNIFRGQDLGNAFDRIGIHFSVGQAF